MRPFLQPLECGLPIPDGWVVEAAGEWNGRQAEAAYDPRRHQVLLARSGAADEMEGGLALGGWEYHSSDGLTSMWVRDRLGAARTRLDREPPATVSAAEPAGGVEAPGL